MALRNSVLQYSLNHIVGTYLWFSGPLFDHCMPMKLSLDKHLTWRKCFILVLSSAKRVPSCMVSLIKSYTRKFGGLVFFFHSGLCRQDPEPLSM